MKEELWLELAAIALLLWGGGFGVYMSCNHGIARNARGQQLRRYLLAALCTIVPMAIAGISLFHPTLLFSLLLSLIWMTTYPLLFHWTNRKMSPDYDNRMDIAMGIYLFGWLTGIYALIPSWGWLIGILQFVLLLLPVFQWVYYFACKNCIDANGMKMLQETHYNEIIEFLRSYNPLVILSVLSGILIVMGVCLSVNIYAPPAMLELPWWKTLLLMGIVGFISVYIWKPQKGIFVRTGVVSLFLIVKEYVEKNNRYITDMQGRINELNVEALSINPKKPSTIMMVIGESASRDFMSAFVKMDRETTPWLDALAKDSEHCIIFPHAYSCDIQTVPTLEKALTEYNQYDGGEFFTSCSVVDIARKLGWKIHWYSNQGHLGAADTPITLVANTSDVAKLTKQELNKVQYDESLIEFLDEVDPQQNNLVVLHLKGSHFNFENRFPASCRKWGKDGDNNNIVNYLNSLHYTDSVLKRFFQYGQKRLNLQAMVYFSDHGCVPDRHRLPNFGGFGDTRIPLVVWLSEEYCQHHPHRAEALRANKECYWTNDLAYELICGIMDIKSNHFKEYNSLASFEYRYTRDDLSAIDGRIKIANDRE
ncbi:MAG: phosphoethanolamine transferase [Bacteroidaceae bacterium]|nr:phosphoethanolamine transferase [Bacteroidaceae bacterium]